MTARTSSIPLYSEIVRENSAHLASVEAQVRALKIRIADATHADETSALEFELISLETTLAKHSLVVILFSATLLEAYIYDYAARHLSDKFAQEYVDKLDVIGKWVVVPRLATGRELPRGKKWFGLMKTLVKTRNLIAHSKSSELPRTKNQAQPYLERIQNKDDQFAQSARQSIELLDLLVAEMSDLDPDESIWIQSYFSPISQIRLEAK